uniref:40S ribosomal protein S8-like n=1 Tax=Sinocyclocheilus anshuiensis TaxID=1608454 RepID=A0A671QZX7_9TELE
MSLFAYSFSIFYRAAEHLCSYSDVFLLWLGGPGASHAEISVVETLSHLTAAGCTRKTRIIDVVYNASNNELVRTKTLVKNCIVLVDSTPFRQWYEAHYAIPLGRKKGAKLTPEEEEILNKKRSKKVQKKIDGRRKKSKISSLLEEQFLQGKLLSCIASRPGQCGRPDGYILEGKALEFYLRKIRAKKGK